jgi:transcription factor WhiB
MTWEVDPALLPTLPGALCAGHSHPELWFDPIHKREAVAICRTCPAIEPCRAFCDELEAGKPFGEWVGVWAGEDPNQRRRRRQG